MLRSKQPTPPSIRTLATTTSLALALGLLAGPGLADPENWDLLGAVTFQEVEVNNEWQVIKRFPEPLTAQADSFTITGYYVPIVPEAYVTNFLIVPDPADCPFCGGSGYGINLEVRMAAPMPDMPEFTTVTITGTLELVDDPYTYQFARLTNATLLASGG